MKLLKPTTSLFILLLIAMTASIANAGRTRPFIIGADISWTPEDEAAGAQYFDGGVRKDLLQILKDHGFNYIRLRIFVNPKSEGGYARNMPEAFCDLAHTEAMAKRIKAAGMGFLLDFHYSDNWADPGKQMKPLAWEALSMPELVQAVHDHTQTVLAALKADGTLPDMVQIGNEITPGMLWPDGRVGNTSDAAADEKQWDNLAALVKSGIKATREINPAISIILHSDAGYSDQQMRHWVDHLLARDVKFDIIGLSCYRQDKEGDWPNTFNDLAQRYPDHDLMVCEYSARKQYINDAVWNVPDQKGLGSFIWEPTRHKEAIFDVNGQNAGGGEQYNYNTTVPSNRPATRPTTRPAPTTSPSVRRRRGNGGRYDTNWLIGLFSEMSRDYGATAASTQSTQSAK